MTAMSEASRFQEAAKSFAASPNNPIYIEAMMKLALEGVNPTICRWAAGWLDDKCNIVVRTRDDIEGFDHATAPEAANIR